MKRIVAVILPLAIVFLLCCCSAKPDEHSKEFISAAEKVVKCLDKYGRSQKSRDETKSEIDTISNNLYNLLIQEEGTDTYIGDSNIWHHCIEIVVGFSSFPIDVDKIRDSKEQLEHIVHYYKQ